MPLMKGHSKEVVSQNIKEMMKAGHPQKQAIAAALASARKSKKMAEGGMVSEDMDEGLGTTNDQEAERSLNQIRIEGAYHPSAEMNPEYQKHEEILARALYKKGEQEEMLGYAMGGLVQSEEPEPMGTKPSEEMGAELSEPMSELEEDRAELTHPVVERVPASGGLSAEAMAAIAKKKKNRRFV